MVSPVTVRQWAAKGRLCAETTLGGHRRFLRRDVDQFARENHLNLRREADGELRVLIVDDDRQLAGYLRELLQQIDNSRLELAFDGFDAGDKIHQFQPHIVLLDLMMTGLDGFSVCERIKSAPVTRLIRVIAMTGYRTPAATRRILAAGAEQCLAKPIDGDALLTLMQDPVQRG